MPDYPPQLEALVNEARLITCEEWAKRRGWKMRRSGPNMSGPCPKCGGTDRFAIEAKADKWNCRKCCVGGNDAISLVQLLDNAALHGKTFGETFIEACEFMVGRDRKQILSQAEIDQREAALKRKRQMQDEESERRRQQARKWGHEQWMRSGPAGDLVNAYMKIRGIETDIGRLLHSKETEKPYSAIREIADLGYRFDGREIHSGPAMMLAVQWADNRFGAVHRTWLDFSERGKSGKVVLIDPKKARRWNQRKFWGAWAMELSGCTRQPMRGGWSWVRGLRQP